MSKSRICLAAITGSFGVKGEVRLKSFCSDPAAVGDYGPLSSEDGKTTYTLTLTRPVKTGFAARLSGVSTKDAADALRANSGDNPLIDIRCPDRDAVAVG